MKEHSTNAFHSGIWRELDLPIRCLVLDESQNAKNPSSSTHEAINKALYVKYTFLVSGTFLTNRWIDAFGAVDLLQGHPFDSLQKFVKAVAAVKVDQTNTNPTKSKEHRLVKFLQAMVVARPAELLDLQGVEVEAVEFVIQDHIIVPLLAHLVGQYMEACKKANKRTTTNTGANLQSSALNNATLAQQFAGNMYTIQETKRKEMFEAYKGHMLPA